MRQNILSKVASSRWTGLAFVLFTYSYLISLPGELKSIWIWLTNAGIVLISCLIIYADSIKTISLQKVSGVFFLLFFGLAPILEYKMKVRYWGGGEISEQDYIVVNVLLIISLLVYYFVYKISFSVSRSSFGDDDDRLLLIAARSRFRFLRLLPFVMISLLIILWFNDFNLYNLLLRGGDLRDADVIVDSKALGLVVNNFLRPFCFSSLILCIFVSRQYFGFNFIWCLILAPVAVLVCFPTAMARFAIAALYIPLILVLFPVILRRGFLAVNVLIGSFVTIFPVFDTFRNINQDFSFKDITFNFEFFTTGHFDAYQNFVRTVSLDIVTNGRQILGAILFFVPRAIWRDKPIGSGEILAEKAHLEFSNIAQSLPAEGYINFGIVGIFVFVIFAAFYSASLDHRFWRKKMPSYSSIFSLYYFQLIGLAVFIWRGDMTNAIAYTSGFMASMAMASHIYKSRPVRLGHKIVW